MYAESAKALRQVGARVFLFIGAAIPGWIFGQMLFLPIAEGITEQFLGYPVHLIVSFILMTLLVIISTTSASVRKLPKELLVRIIY